MKLFISIVLCAFVILGTITGILIYDSWKTSHNDTMFIVTCVIYAISIVLALVALLWLAINHFINKNV